MMAGPEQTNGQIPQIHIDGQPSAETERYKPFEAAAITAMLGWAGIDRDTVPTEFQAVYDRLRSGYFKDDSKISDALSRLYDDRSFDVRTGYYYGFTDELEMTLLDNADTDDLDDHRIGNLAELYAERILQDAGIALWIEKEELDGRIAGAEWILGLQAGQPLTPSANS